MFFSVIHLMDFFVVVANLYLVCVVPIDLGLFFF